MQKDRRHSQLQGAAIASFTKTMPEHHCQNLSIASLAAGIKNRNDSRVDGILALKLDHTGDETNITDLLLFELHPSVKYAKVVLLFEAQFEILHALFVNVVLDRSPPTHTVLLAVIERLDLIEKLFVLAYGSNTVSMEA